MSTLKDRQVVDVGGQLVHVENGRGGELRQHLARRSGSGVAGTGRQRKQKAHRLEDKVVTARGAEHISRVVRLPVNFLPLLFPGDRASMSRLRRSATLRPAPLAEVEWLPRAVSQRLSVRYQRIG